ncbi:MAG: type IV secretory system conjugative DNA transfer family protein [bacterium]
MDPEQITYFGETDSRGKRVRFGIKAKDRTKHIYVIGKTGMGKSTLLENMAIQDIQNGEGMAFMDPHGKTAELLLNYVPPERLNDVVYFAPFDVENPISFNVLEDVGVDKRHLVVSGLMSTFKKIWVDAWSARMEYILTNTLLALIEYPGATLLGVNRMLADKEYRKRVVDNVKDVSVKSFWIEEFAKYTDRMAAEAVPAIQNKIGQFTANPLIRNIVGQPKSSFDLRKLMDEKKIIIINLSKGRVGEANANLLGSMMITKIYLAAMSRADVSEKNLKNLPNFYLYVDEFQSFANESFADILSEARKYKLNLTIAHQYIEQMSEEVRAAVFGNVGTMITFRVGAYDAEVLEKEFAPQFTAEDLVNLGMFQMYIKLMIDGVGSSPFSASSLPPFSEPIISYKTEIVSNSRKNFSKLRAEVEEIIKKWIEDAKISMKITTISKPVFNNANNQKSYQTPLMPKTFVEKAEIKKLDQEKIPIPVASKPTEIEKSKPRKNFPPIGKDIDDDFLPLKELAKKLVVEPKTEEVQNEVSKKPEPVAQTGSPTSTKPKFTASHTKTMSAENLSGLRSALAAVMKKTESVAPKIAKPEIPKVESQIKIHPVKSDSHLPAQAGLTGEEEPKVEPKKEEMKKEKVEDSKNDTKEISEEDLKKVLGL